jgi:hypothetical protein
VGGPASSPCDDRNAWSRGVPKRRSHVPQRILPENQFGLEVDSGQIRMPGLDGQ